MKEHRRVVWQMHMPMQSKGFQGGKLGQNGEFYEYMYRKQIAL